MPVRAVALMSDGDKLQLAKALWMAAFETVLKSCKEEGFSSEITFQSMIEVMTEVMKILTGEKE